MREEPYLLDMSQRKIVLAAIKEACAYRAWSLLAAHIRTNHDVIYEQGEPMAVFENLSRSLTSPAAL